MAKTNSSGNAGISKANTEAIGKALGGIVLGLMLWQLQQVLIQALLVDSP